jgi:AcrR family transcriptional regulator
MNDTHQKLLQVTCRLFAESGYQGTTTRRIADAAGVNEVTLFRHFGSKDALIRAALSTMGGRSGPLLDSDADDPAAELDRWGLQVFYHYYEHRNLIRRIMGEMVEHQELGAFVMEDCGREYNQLVAFFRSLETRGLTTPNLCAEAAAGMFLSSLLINALWRDVWPDVPNPEENIRHYVRLAARAIELRERAPAAVAGRRNGGSRRGAR